MKVPRKNLLIYCLISGLLIFNLKEIQANTVGKIKGGVGAIGDFIPIVGGFVDIFRGGEKVFDKIKLVNSMSEPVDYQCDFLNNGEWTTLKPSDAVEHSTSRSYEQSYEAYCKFRLKSRDVQLPRKNLGEKCCMYFF